jgi:hypothetical protein
MVSDWYLSLYNLVRRCTKGPNIRETLTALKEISIENKNMGVSLGWFLATANS